MDIHTGGSYKCTECDQRFPRPSRLREHVRVIQSGENPNKCTECGKYFANSFHCADTSAHSHIVEKLYKCTKNYINGMWSMFSRRDKLREHVRRIHTGG
ncbi:hypothetical protein CEXT_799771 [Caerostris extrusa]|uniref:C2H2-type domain-containing protein n=1 Tax=Caerostris extrusa TaxID=172846 RepID=A0AAV4PZF9_CAEEX|nr:hypothetical protein CEXT_799771 [Caerostris extrusa]